MFAFLDPPVVISVFTHRGRTEHGRHKAEPGNESLLDKTLVIFYEGVSCLAFIEINGVSLTEPSGPDLANGGARALATGMTQTSLALPGCVQDP